MKLWLKAFYDHPRWERLVSTLRELDYELGILEDPQDLLDESTPRDLLIAPLEDFSDGNLLAVAFAQEVYPIALSEDSNAAEICLGLGIEEVISFQASPERWKLRIEALDRLLGPPKLEEEILSQIPGMVYRYEIHPSGRQQMSFMSPSVARIFGPRPEDLKEIEPFFAIVHPEDLPGLQDSVRQSHRELSPWNYEFRIQAQGAYRWFHGQSTPQRQDDGRVVWHGIFRDIHLQKKLEERLRLTDRLTTLGTLAAGITHEINNPLSIILNNLQELHSLATGPDQEKESALNASLRAAKRIEKIVRSLEGFAFLGPTSLEPICLVRPLEDGIQILKTDLPSRVHLVFQKHSTPVVMGRRNELLQVFLNLLLNASQALSAAGTSIESPRISVIIEAEERSPSGFAVVIIEDNGPGIAAKHRSQIFDPFFTTKDIGEGSGLGLYICHTLVTAMQGRIEVECGSEGTRFIVLLPLATTESA